MMTMSINMGSISNSSSSNSNMEHYNNSEYNEQYYTHDHIAYNNVHDPYSYQHNQHNHSTQYNYHHHHHTNTNKIKNDQILKKFNQFFHNDLTNSPGSAEQINENIVTVCNGLSYTNLDYHYNEHLFRKHQYENSCQQYQKHERYHGFYNENSHDKREHFIQEYDDRGHEHTHSKENYLAFDAISEKEHLHSSEQLESVPLRTPEQYMPTEDQFRTANGNVSLQTSNKNLFHDHVSVLNNKLTYQTFEARSSQDIEELDQRKNEVFIDNNSSRRTIIKEIHTCSKLIDKDSSNNDKCEEFIQYDRGNYYNETFNSSDATKARNKSGTCDKVSDKEIVTSEKVSNYNGVISPAHEYCHGHSDYNPADYYSDVNIKEEEYDLSSYYQNEYYPHSNHTILPHTHHAEHQNGLSTCDDRGISECNNAAGDSSANSSSKSVVPTYKWMQVKRNVPKPQGKNFNYSK